MLLPRVLTCALAATFALVGCGGGSGDDPDGGSGGGDGAGGGDGGGGGGDGDGGQQCGTLLATIHDFKPAGDPGGHPDFEPDSVANNWPGGAHVTGLVKTTLGAAGVPELADGLGAQLKTDAFIHEASDFAKWYVDDALNQRIEQPLPLTETPAGSGNFVFEDNNYFPIDGMGYGNHQCPNGPNHNYHFTTRLHAEFEYKGGESFEFRGDDDVWVFINGQLVIDIGGIHAEVTRSVDLDSLGLTTGQTYAIDFFQAERHCTGSNFKITTSIACFTGGGIIL